MTALATTTTTETELIEACQRGCPRAWDCLVQMYGPAIYHFVLPRVANAAEAEDVTQDVYVKLLTGLSQFQGRSRFRTWLCAVALNALKTRQRKPQIVVDPTKDDLIDPGENPHDLASKAEQLDRLKAAIRTLPPNDQELVSLRVQGHKYSDIASALGIPEGTVGSRWHGIAKVLRAILTDKE